MQKNSHCLQRRIFQPGENLFQFKLEITLFVPLVTINQRNLIHADQHDKARRFRGTKENLCYQVLIRYLTQNTFIKSAGRIIVYIIGAENKALHNARIRFFRCAQQRPKQRRPITLCHFQIDRNGQRIIHCNNFGLALRVSQRFQVIVCQDFYVSKHLQINRGTNKLIMKCIILSCVLAKERPGSTDFL